jgi:ATP phosphoribosyltransferase regulatory subunit
VRDFLPRAAARRRALAATALAHFERWGYQPIITPQFECADVLERGLGPDGRRSALRFVEPESGEVVALRPDITPQVARIAATRMGDIEGPLRLCYQGAVIRQTDGARGQREILQAGVELLGAGEPHGDGEIVALAAELLLEIGLEPCRLEVGHIGLARALRAGVEDPELRAELEERLARRDVSGAERLAARLEEPLAGLARALPRLAGSPDRVAALAEAAGVAALVAPVLADIEAVLAAAAEQAPAAMAAIETSIDLGEVRGFPYYTGIRIAGWVGGAGGPVLVGGRYDQLVERYGGDRRATGFALDVEATAEAAASAGVALPFEDGVLVAAGAAGRDRARQLAAALRRRGHRAALELGGLRGRRRLRRYADQAGFAAVLIVEGQGAMLLGREGAPIPVSARAIAAALGDRPGALDRLLDVRKS